MKEVRIAIIGCGAVAEQAHLPALRSLGLAPALLVDTDLKRTRCLAEAFGVPEVTHDYHIAFGKVDAAIVATPNHLHAPIARALLLAGVHVLVEKPMARSSAECADLLAAAETTGAVLMVGLRRRYLHVSQWVAQTLAADALGEIESFDFSEGYVFGWPTVSDSFWRRDLAGGGVLLDIGAHVLDQLLWWFGPVAAIEYHDDAMGGVEADCSISVTMNSGVRGRVELSRTRLLRNSVVISGSRGRIEAALDGNWAECHAPGLSRYPLFPRQAWSAAFPLELKNWLGAIAGKEALVVSAREAATTISLIETCYAARRPLILPWLCTAQPALGVA